MPRRPARKVYRRNRKAKKSVVSKSVKTYVKRAISRHQENKETTSFSLNQSILTQATATPTAINLLPTPAQGSGDADRIGNEIEVKKLVVTGFVNMLPYDATNNPTAPAPLLVKMWVVSAKNINTNTFSNTSASSSFFQTSNSSTGFQATIRDQLLPVNPDLFTVHRVKTFKIGFGSLSGANLSTVVSTAFDNSPMIKQFTFDCSKYVSKLKYDEGQTWPTNKNMFLVTTVTRADGSTTSATLAPAEYHWRVQCIYKDA